MCVWFKSKYRKVKWQPQFSSAYRAVEKGLGDVKHFEFSNLYNLKIQDVLYTLKILFSVFCNIAECYRIFSLCVWFKSKYRKVKWQPHFSSAYQAVDKGLGDVKHHEFSNLHILKLENVLHTFKILFSLFCKTEYYLIFLLCFDGICISLLSYVKWTFWRSLTGTRTERIMSSEVTKFSDFTQKIEL